MFKKDMVGLLRYFEKNGPYVCLFSNFFFDIRIVPFI